MIEGKAGPKLISLTGLAIIGLLAGSLLTAGMLFLEGISLQSLMEEAGAGMISDSPGIVRLTLLIQHLTMFILPALIFGYIWYRPEILKGFDMEKVPGVLLIVLGGAFLFVSLPLVNLSFMLNQQIDLPSWAVSFESEASDTLMRILEMDNTGTFLLNLGLIALIPAIGEELIFRGIVQKYIGKLANSKVIGIWVAALLFSLIHFQFEGFLPRMVLGAILGYLYVWTGTLWIPIFAHFINNGLQVSTLYFTGIDLSQVEGTSEAPEISSWMILGSVALMFGIYLLIQQQVKKMRHV